MKITIPYWLWGVAMSLSVSVSSAAEADSCLCVYLKGGGVEAYPAEVLKKYQQTDRELEVMLKNDSLLVYDWSMIDSIGAMPTDFPTFTSFKFNNKYNDNVYTDVYATIGEDSITAKVGGIGKRLTPSFSLSSVEARAYLEGELQESRMNRMRFDQAKVYTVTHLPFPQGRKLTSKLVKDAVWTEGSEGKPIFEPVPLTAQQLSTNAPSNYPENEGLDKLLDGDVQTIFHSTWGSGAFEKLPLEKAPYIEVELEESLQDFAFCYTTRPNNDSRNPKSFLVQGSNDRVHWTDVRHLAEEDGIPGWGAAATYESPLLHSDQPYRFLRFVMTESAYKNYLALAEFSIQKYVGESEPVHPELISPAKYAYMWAPLGRDYVVKVDWLTDAPEARVPRIDIRLLNGRHFRDINKNDYFEATMSIDGGGVFPDMAEDSLLIKGRGNTSWHGGMGKNPYRLKFLQSVKPFGLTKGKNWVLLANSIRGSMLTNAIALKIARMVGTAAPNDIVPVELYINGEYRGHYNFTQHVGFHNNSVDIDETNAVRLELDNNYDDDPQFKNAFYKAPTKIKDPDFNQLPAGSVLTKQKIMDDFNAFSTDLYYQSPDLEEKYDVTMLAKYFLVNELVYNHELMHPKSCFVYREDLQAMHSKYIFGPVWDFDWAYGYEYGSFCPADYGMNYEKGILAKNEPGGRFYVELYHRRDLKRAYYKEWKQFMELHFEEMCDFIDDYFDYVRPSLEHNATVWSNGMEYTYASKMFRQWLYNRAQHIYDHLEVFDLDQPKPIERGDVNKDGYVTLADVVCVHNYLMGLDNECFDAHQADANADHTISITDAVWIVAWAMQTEMDATRHLMLPRAEAKLETENFTATLGSLSAMPVTLETAERRYAAAQFDVELPEGMTVVDVVLPGHWENCQVETAELGDHTCRVAVLADDGTALPEGKGELRLLLKSELQLARAERVVTVSGVTLVNDLGEDERVMGKSACFDMEVTGVDAAVGTEAVCGGHSLVIEALKDSVVKIYTLDGRLFKECTVTAGTHSIALPSGVYIVNHHKVVINQ